MSEMSLEHAVRQKNKGSWDSVLVILSNTASSFGKICEWFGSLDNIVAEII